MLIVWNWVFAHCAVLYLVVQSCLFATPRTVARQAPLSMGILQQEYWSGLPCPPPGDLLNPGIKHRSPALQADTLPSKPKNPGVGSLSLLQGICPTQESNWGLLHCRWILYQLSYQGSPIYPLPLSECGAILFFLGYAIDWNEKQFNNFSEIYL